MIPDPLPQVLEELQSGVVGGVQVLQNDDGRVFGGCCAKAKLTASLTASVMSISRKVSGGTGGAGTGCIIASGGGITGGSVGVTST